VFYGEYEHALDKKNRVIIPVKFRDALKQNYVEKFFITRGLDKCLFVFTEDEWRVQEQKFKTRSFTKSEVRKFNRIFFSGASDVGCDKQGRILVPQYLKEYAEIKKDVFIIGVSNRFEIWSKDNWNNFYTDTKDSFEEIAENLIEE